MEEQVQKSDTDRAGYATGFSFKVSQHGEEVSINPQFTEAELAYITSAFNMWQELLAYRNSLPRFKLWYRKMSGPIGYILKDRVRSLDMVLEAVVAIHFYLDEGQIPGYRSYKRIAIEDNIDKGLQYVQDQLLQVLAMDEASLH